MSVTPRIHPLVRPRLALSLLAFALAACASGPGGGAQIESTTPMTPGATTPQRVSNTIASWPAKQRETVIMLTAKYGEPTVMGDRMVVWYATGAFLRTAVARDEIPHNFPMPHVDYLTQTVKHRVPADKLDDLYEYDGSVWYHRTRGELSAQCDVEEMNFLALNLAHDVIMGKRTPADARAFYAKTAMAFKQGDKSSPYVQGLIFEPEPNAADPDRPHSM